MSEKSRGYRNPPVHSRFKKGQSGNPGGRKKGCRNLKTVMEELMALEVEQPGKKRKIELQEALLLKQADCGLKGDWRATDSLLDRYERHTRNQTEPQSELPEEDDQMLDAFLERRQRSSEAEAEPKPEQQTEHKAEPETKPDQEPEVESKPELDQEPEANE